MLVIHNLKFALCYSLPSVVKRVLNVFPGESRQLFLNSSGLMPTYLLKYFPKNEALGKFSE